jgi:glutamate-1-semialdehyde 2,1-aminomutase
MATVTGNERVEALKQEVRGVLPRSAARAERDRLLIPGGTTRSRFWWPIPIYIDHGEGVHVTDIDGRTYIDCNLAFGPLILGHSHPAVTGAIRDQLDRGVLFGPANEWEADLAKMIVDNVPGADMVSFAGSGMEATLGALRLARAATGRQKVAKFEGGFHGMQDFLHQSFNSFGGPTDQPETIPDSGGITDAVRDSVVALPFNDPVAFKLIEERADEIACVIVEPVQGGGGAIPVDEQFLLGLSDVCSEHGVLLILDEVITGFRLSPSGGAGMYGVEPDLVALGKVIGGGLGAGAVAGRGKYLDLMRRGVDGKAVGLGSTHAANPISMAAGRAQLQVLLGAPELYEQINRLGARMRDGLSALLHELDIVGHVTGAGSIWGIHFSDRAPASIRDLTDANRWAARVLPAYLLFEDVLMSAPYHLGFLSTEHTEEDIDTAIDGHRRALVRMTEDGWFPE